MSEIKIVEGELFSDKRGIICSVNNFRFDGVKRFYFIHHPDITVQRGWHGHKFEKKWFYCVSGAFKFGFVKPDDWENPSEDLIPEWFRLSGAESEIICLPAGYANWIQAEEPDSILLVLSGNLYPEEAIHDSWRYDPAMWIGNK